MSPDLPADSTPDDPDDTPLFADEDGEPESSGGTVRGSTPWRVLVVDDDPEVLAVTQVVMADLAFRNRPVDLLTAHTAAQAWEILTTQDDIALILLDVVMETDHAGLDLVRRIRGELGNHLVRIVLRTGQPGRAPEREVIVGYDINDYKAKTELTAQKLFTTVIAGLRGYEDMLAVEVQRRDLARQVAQRAQRLHDVLHALGEGVFGCDAGGRITFVNPALCALLGQPAAALEGRAVGEHLSLTGPGGRPFDQAANPLFATLADGQRRELDDHGLSVPAVGWIAADLVITAIRDGAIADHPATGPISGAVCAVRDVRDRREAFAVLQRQVDLLQQLVASLPTATFYTDAGGCIVDASQAFADLVGLSGDDLAGCPLADALPAPLDELVETISPDEVLREGGRAIAARLLPTDPDADPATGPAVELRLTAYTDPAGGAAGLLGEIHATG